MQRDLFPLLDYLADATPQEEEAWRGWRITPVHGGANNLVFRIRNGSNDFAAKFTIRDQRDRAGREYAALQALQEAGLQISPAPVLLKRERYQQPVVVQTWLEGEPVTSVPQTDAAWRALIEHYHTIHTVTPNRSTASIRDAVVNAASVRAGRAMIAEQVAHVPATERPSSLLALLNAFDTLVLPTWPSPPRVLCRVDANCRNFVRQPGGMASVDWENSGWGDGAFEIAELIAHPMYEHVSEERRHWIMEQYAQGRADLRAAMRIDSYITIMLVWWVARLARYLYEMPRGRDVRLVQHPAYQIDELRRKYDDYLDRAWKQVRRTQ